MDNGRSYSIHEKRSAWAGAFIGLGMMAAIDEIVFHQLLQWHHFYDLSTPEIALFADGLLHSFELIAIVAGFFMVLNMQKRATLVRRAAIAGFFLGSGGFQLWDGIVDHKILRTHQIRYGVDLLPYDLFWNLVGLVLLVIGLGILVSVRSIGPQRAGGYAGQHP